MIWIALALVIALAVWVWLLLIRVRLLEAKVDHLDRMHIPVKERA